MSTMFVVPIASNHSCLERYKDAEFVYPNRMKTAPYLDSMSESKLNSNPYGLFVSKAARSNVEYLWFVEDDVYFHGDFNKFMNQYESSTADLIAFPLREHLQFYTYRTCSLIQRNTTADQVCKMSSAIFRLSKRFALHVLKSYKKGTTCYHEVVFPTLCAQTAWCKSLPIAPKHVGVLHLPGGRSRKRCCALSSYDLRPGRFYHPSKCEAMLEYHAERMPTAAVDANFCTH